MFCPNCGCQLSDGAKFCTFCGTDVSAAPAQPKKKEENVELKDLFGDYFGDAEESVPAKAPASQSGYYQPSAKERKEKESTRAAAAPKEKKPRKKKKGVIRGILITVLAVLAGRLVYYAVSEGVHAGADAIDRAVRDRKQEEALNSEDKGKGVSAEEGSGKGSKAAAGSLAYQNAFSDAGLVPENNLAGRWGEYTAFVEVDEDGWVYHYEFLCDDDLIITMADSVYVPLEGYDPEEVDALEEIYRDSFASVAELDFCELRLERRDDFLKILILQEDVDEEANIQALISVDYLNATGGGLLSMEMTRTNLLADGLVEY